MSAAKKTVDLKSIRDIELDSVTVRDVNADDMMEAAARCVPPDGSALDGNLFSMALRQQLVAQAIVDFIPRVGDRAGMLVTVAGSCQDSITWSSRTREFVGEIFDFLNGVSNDERETFRKALASSSTPGSPDAVRAE
jgi:hypothetical protein